MVFDVVRARALIGTLTSSSIFLSIQHKSSGNSGVQAAIAQTEATLSQDGRLLIRRSGTEPLVRGLSIKMQR